jgi:hypothetical protein
MKPDQFVMIDLLVNIKKSQMNNYTTLIQIPTLLQARYDFFAQKCEWTIGIYDPMHPIH